MRKLNEAGVSATGTLVSLQKKIVEKQIPLYE
jgi:hypothetical protein